MPVAMSRRRALLGLSTLLLTGPAAAAPARKVVETQGLVTQVIDAATVRFTPTGGTAITVRLRDIDPPEPCQPWGAEARAALSAMALNKPATLRAGPADAKGRVVGVLIVEEANLGRRMVEEGHAWSVRFRNDQGPMVKYERMAKALNRGLHSTPGAVMPREWRRTRPCPAAS
jgi:micrococcal nuclease